MFGLSKKRLFGDAFWAMFGQLASAIALLAGTRVLTELVTPDIYGQVALLNGFVALGVAVFSYPFICAGMRMLPECRNGREREDLYKAVSGLSARSTGLAIVLLVLCGAAYAYMAHSDPWLFCLAGILLAVTVRRELGIQMLIGGRNHRAAGLWQTSDSVLRPIMAIGLVWYVGQNAAWVLAGYALASIASNAVWSIIYGSDPDAKPASRGVTDKHFRRDVWVYAAPLIPMELIFWINGLGDRYVIGFMLTASEVGLYAATYLIINEAFNRSAMILLRTFQPAYFQAYSENRIREANSVLWIWIACVLAMGVIGVLLLLATKDWVAAWALAKSYHSAVDLMPAIAVGCALHALGTVAAQPLLARKKTKFMLKGRVCGAVTSAICLPLMVHYYGLPGAAMANPLYFGVETLVLALLAKPWRNIAAKQADTYHQADDDVAALKVNA
ncbi:MAG: lipopolysaccharide biosynthesis protein [Methylomonas sp.]